MSRLLVIAVDGPAAAGKGTLARRLAAHFGLAYLDTGALYRAVGRRVLREGGDPTDGHTAGEAARRLSKVDLADPDLRSLEAGQAASTVAVHPTVRAALFDFQRRFVRQPPDGKPGSVLDGRDIGTVIAPEAPVKIFLTASLEARAERRLRELRARDLDTIRARVLAEMAERDRRDSERAAAPLMAAPDAYQLDTSTMDEDAVFAAVVGHISSKGF